MPVSGNEETGVKSYAGQFSGLIAGVPIKKRRFPLIQPSSPLSEEPCSLTEETELLNKEHSSTSQGSTLSNSTADAPIKKRRFPLIQTSEQSCSLPEENDALRKEHSSTSQGSSLSTSSSGLSNTNRIHVFEERKASCDVMDTNLVQSNSNYIRPRLEDSNLATDSCTLDVMDSKEKVILNEGCDVRLGSQIIKGKPELLLAVKEELALNVGADISKQNVRAKCKQGSSAVPESTNLSLGLKEKLFPDVASRDIDGSCQKMEKAEPVSLKLSLSKEEGCTRSSSCDATSNSDTAQVHSSRANWDLNTTMDAWEEPGSDASSGRTSFDGLRITGSAHDENQFICSTGMAKQTQEESESKAFPLSSALYGQQYKCVEPRNLCLTPPYLQKCAEEPSRSSVKLNSSSAIPSVNLFSVVSSDGDVNTASLNRIVKSEPFDENLKQDLKEATPCLVRSSDSAPVKHELVERSNAESFKSSNGSNLKLLDPKFIKSEPGHDGKQERLKTTENKPDPSGLVSYNCSSALAMPVASESMAKSAAIDCLPVKPVGSTELTASVNLTANHVENSACTEAAHVDDKVLGGDCPTAEQAPLETVAILQGDCPTAEKAPLETVAIAMVDSGTDSSGPCVRDSFRSEEETVDDPEGCRLKLMNEPLPDLHGSGEGCASDDEKITLSADMLEDDSYGSDYESDDNLALTVAMDTEQYDREDDDYEDGEVREPLEHSTADDTICEVREVEQLDCSSYENKQFEKGVVSGDCPTSFHVEEDGNNTVTHNEINSGKDCDETEICEKSGKVTDKNVCLQESLDTEKPIVGSDGKRPVAVKVLQSKSSDDSEKKNVSKASETELLSEQATNGIHGVDVTLCADEVVIKTDTVKTDSDLSKMEASSNADDVTKDVNGGNQGRIINLSLAASSTSPSKTRSLSGRPLPSRAGRDVLSETLEGDRLQRGRDEVYIDGTRRFSRERQQDMSPRNSRLNFVRGRGRVISRLDTIRGEWESDREYAGEFYNGPSQFRNPRHKYASAAITNTDLEYNNIAPDGSYVGTGRVGRKPLNDEGPLCHRIPRRRSPRGRDGIQMGNRIPRTMSPSRCIGGDGSEMVGLRHNEKFMRGFPEDTFDPMFTRPQQFEGLEGRFTRGSRSFNSFHRRGIPRIRSKSPIQSRSRSPGPWPSPRRRSPRRRSTDGFGGHPEMTHRRSPLYRVDRMRVVRRHGSPSYMSRPSNDIRDIDSGRDHGHPRSVISSRSPGRIMIGNRRFDVDPRDRAENDDYFGGPLHSGRFELSGEGNGDERRRFGERRGPVRSFRPPFNGTVGENFHLNAENGPRHYRFCTDEDSDFHERGNLRERDFDRRIKSRPTNVPPRRARNIDEQETNYRHGQGRIYG